MLDPNDLINTKVAAPRQTEMSLASWQSWDYFHLNPYPAHAFGPKQWPRDKGPVPTALPYCSTLIAEGAEFVFRGGNPIFSVPDLPGVDLILQSIIKHNQLNEMWIPLAETNGNQGAIAAKFTLTPDGAACPVRVTFLDIPQECRVWVDPHDRNRILMARIQYPYRDMVTGKWFYYREEWTDDYYVTYVPKSAGEAHIANMQQIAGYRDHLGDEGNWEIDEQEENPFGLIPITVIRNKTVVGNPLGVGDCWSLFRIIDRIAITMHGEDRANQLHSEPITVFKNADADNEGPLLPGEAVSVRNENADVDADVKLLEPSGAAREYSQWTIDKWEDLLYKGAGLSRVDTKAVTNKGNMTALAFAMTFARTISTSDRKREQWGQSGMCLFFRNMLLALNRFGLTSLRAFSEQTDVNVEWPTYFEQTDDDKANLTTRTGDQMDMGVLPLERGAERIARAEKIPAAEIPELLREIRGIRERAAAAQKALIDSEESGTSGKLAIQDLAETANISATSGVNNMTA